LLRVIHISGLGKKTDIPNNIDFPLQVIYFCFTSKYSVWSLWKCVYNEV
jgi:hypothetical protein